MIVVVNVVDDEYHEKEMLMMMIMTMMEEKVRWRRGGELRHMSWSTNPFVLQQQQQQKHAATTDDNNDQNKYVQRWRTSGWSSNDADERKRNRRTSVFIRRRKQLVKNCM